MAGALRTSLCLLALLLGPWTGHAIRENIRLPTTPVSPGKQLSNITAMMELDADVDDSANANTDHDDRPLVYNNCKMPLVVYLECGYLFNKQVIHPGEAARLYSEAHGPRFSTFSIVALVGAEDDLPTPLDSLVNLAGVLAVPAAFAIGVAASVASGGVLVGPAAAFAVGAANITAGATMAGSVEQVAKKLMKTAPKAFMVKKRHVFPGTKYFEITGGPDGRIFSDLKITEISPGEYMMRNVTKTKQCDGETSTKKVDKTIFTIVECGDPRARGDWKQIGVHSHRPRYQKIGDKHYFMEWSASRVPPVWRMYHDNTWLGRNRVTLYQSTENSGTFPETGWECVNGGTPVPELDVIMMSQEDAEPMHDAAKVLVTRHSPERVKVLGLDLR